MTKKYVLAMLACLTGSALAFWGALLLLSETKAMLKAASRFIDAPKLTGGEDITEHGNNLVWISGSLRPEEGREPLLAPLSGKKCLYFHYEKSRYIEVEPDSDEQNYWQVEVSETGAVAVVLQAESKRFTLDNETIVYKRTPPDIDKEEDIDRVKYRFVEHTIPLDNTVTVIGILKEGVLLPTEVGTVVSTSSLRELMVEYKSDAVFRLFFTVLVFLIAAGLFAVFLKLLFAERIPGPTPKEILFFFGGLGYVWIWVGGVLLFLGSESPEDKLLLIIMVPGAWGLVLLIPLVFFACRNKASVRALLFIPAVGLACFSALFYYDAFFTAGNFFPPLAAAIPLSLGAAVIIALCRWVTGRRYKTGLSKDQHHNAHG